MNTENCCVQFIVSKPVLRVPRNISGFEGAKTQAQALWGAFYDVLSDGLSAQLFFARMCVKFSNVFACVRSLTKWHSEISVLPLSGRLSIHWLNDSDCCVNVLMWLFFRFLSAPSQEK
jgi:hypothetical protein